MDELYTLYSPSYWSKRLPRDIIVSHHLKFIEKENQTVRKNIPNQLDLAYGNFPREKINIFGTDLKDDAPIFVFIHGGYWEFDLLGRESYEFISKNLYNHGIKSIFIGYELCPNVTLTQLVQGIERGARKCIDYALAKKSRGIHFSGHSAGGHLVACLFTTFIKSLTKPEQELIKSAIMISGIFDLSPYQKAQNNNLLKSSQDEISQLSPQKVHISDGNGTKFYCVVGGDESPEFMRQSREFHEKLAQLGYDAYFVQIPDTDHYDIIENLCRMDFDLTKLIRQIIIE